MRAGRYCTLSRELEFVAGRLCDLPGCAESAESVVVVSPHAPFSLIGKEEIVRRVIGMDIHRTFAEVVVWEDGRLRHAGRVDMTRTALEGFGKSLKATGEIVVDLSVISGSILAAAIGMMDQARRRILPLDGHGQCCDRQFRPHVIAHRPADDPPGEKIEHDGQIEPSSPSWHISYVGEPDLVGPFGDEVLSEPVGGDGPIMTAVRGACPKPSRRYCGRRLGGWAVAMRAWRRCCRRSPGLRLDGRSD